MEEEKVAQNIEGKERTDDVLAVEKISFADLLLSKPILDGLTRAGFERPSPIQLKAIPYGRCGLDLIVQAKSGTGKTCVFAVVALETIITEGSSCQVLVLAPTREIAVQIWEVITSIGSGLHNLHCSMFIGGLPLIGDKQKLQRCHIAIGTPGRIKQLIEEGILNTESIRLFVLDEADKLLEDSFQNTINWIFSSLPANKQMLALSATYPEVLAQHLTAYMRNPTFVRLNSSDPALLGIRQYFKSTPFHPLPQKVFESKSTALMELLSSVTFNQCLVFSNYQIRAQSLSDLLVSRGWPTTYISGSQDQQHRLTAMAKLKQFHCRVLISTDLTSRGIDAENVNLVVNLDIPKDHDTYLHRIGRAGRFGSFGAAVSIVCMGKEMADLMTIEKNCNTCIKSLPDPIPEDLARGSGYIHINDLVVTEKLVSDPDRILCNSLNNGSKFADKTDENVRNEENIECYEGIDHHSGEVETLSKLPSNGCVGKHAKQRLQEQVSDVAPATKNASLVSEVACQALDTKDDKRSEKIHCECDMLKKNCKPNVISNDNSQLLHITRKLSNLSSSLRRCEHILDNSKIFEDNGHKMPHSASDEAMLPGDRHLEESCGELKEPACAISQLLKNISLEREGLKGNFDKVGNDGSDEQKLTFSFPYSYSEGTFNRHLSVKGSSSRANGDQRSHAITVPEFLQTPLSIVIDESQFCTMSKEEQKGYKNHGMDFFKITTEHDLTSEDLTSISALEESDTESESSSTDLCSLSSRESEEAAVKDSVKNRNTRDYSHYPHTQFVPVDESPFNDINLDPYSDSVVGNDNSVSNGADGHGSNFFYKYDACEWWKHTLEEAIQYSKWINDVHISHYANFCMQNYEIHRQYAEYYKKMYQMAEAQLKEL